jgi:hypothetical protein
VGARSCICECVVTTKIYIKLFIRIGSHFELCYGLLVLPCGKRPRGVLYSELNFDNPTIIGHIWC